MQFWTFLKKTPLLSWLNGGVVSKKKVVFNIFFTSNFVGGALYSNFL